MFLLAGHIPAKGECVIHPSGWRLEAVDSDPRKIIRVRLHAPEAKRLTTSSVANSFAGSAIALNSSALPAGSSRNMVACSPGSPSKRTVGSITNSTPARCEPFGQRLPVVHRQHQPEVRHRHVLAVDRVACARARRPPARDGRRSGGRAGRSRSNGRRFGLPGSRAARRRSGAPRQGRRPGRRDGRAAGSCPTIVIAQREPKQSSASFWIASSRRSSQ